MPWQLTALEAAERIRDGALTSLELVDACLARIAETDGDIGAWAFLDPEHARAQAEAMDELRRSGFPTGPLHGVPVGIKDIFDTADMPTCYGTPIHAGRQPAADCAVVSKLKEAGAVILGKTVTTEFAFMHAADTRNPHDRERTPGGSSSGSCAAVAAGHVPLAVGSQTNGSTIRPASFCGIYGFKPTRGIISRRGVLATSETLDQVGVFGRTLGDVAVLADVLGGYDPEDAATYVRPKPRIARGAAEEVPVEPAFAWFELHYHDRLTGDAREGFEELLEALGDRVERFPAPESLAPLLEHHQVIHEYEIARHLKADIDTHWDQISETIKPALERGQNYSDDRYREALAIVSAARDYFAEMFNDVDAIITPSATGEAPSLASGTGDPVFCTIWTLAGLPCVSLPLMSGQNGLPIGVQLIGSSEHDDRLLRTANWMQNHLQAYAGNNEQG
ncbi:MAG: amidase [Hyphomicrobiaceae bacterium]